MTLYKARPIPPKLNAASLQELALRYVGKYATTRAKLRSYLARKLRERGWGGESEPDVEALAERLAGLGYIDDAAYALSKSRSFVSRGYGKRRLTEKLRIDGVDETDGLVAQTHADENAVDTALRYAERRRIGPYSSALADIRQREKWISAMVRAGHPFALARVIVSLPPGTEIEKDTVLERFVG